MPVSYETGVTCMNGQVFKVVFYYFLFQKKREEDKKEKKKSCSVFFSSWSKDHPYCSFDFSLGYQQRVAVVHRAIFLEM